MTACCQRKEPRARSGSRMLAVCRSCRRSSRIVNVIKLKKGTIEITTIRTCKNGLTVSQSRNGCMLLYGNGIRIITAVCHQPDCSREVVPCSVLLLLLRQGIFVVFYVRKQNLTRICRDSAPTIILKSESNN